LLAFAIVMHCMALDEDNQIRISFWVWSPSSMNLDLVEEVISDVLRSFLCHDESLIILDTHLRSVCNQRDIGEKYEFSNIAKLSDPIRSYLSDEASNVLISESYEIDGTIQGAWDVNYEVLKVGAMEIEKAKMSDATDEMAYMEHRIQQHLNLSIIKGVVNTKLRGTEIMMGKLGHEFGTLPKSSSASEEELIHIDPELNHRQPAIILRYIGMAMIYLTTISGIFLTYLGRRHIRDEERKEKAALDPEYQRGLDTEQGVNLMLERGRRETEWISTNPSK